MPCCEAHKFGNWCSNEEVITVGSKEYCVYHAPTKASKKPTGKALYHMVRDKIQHSLGDCRFDGSVFSGDLPLKSLTINGSLSFEGCCFEGDFSFFSSTIKGDLSFSGSIFKKKLSIGELASKNIQAKGKKYYFTTQVVGGVQFYAPLKIDGNIKLDGVTLHGSLTLKQFSNGGNLNLSNLTANQRVSLNLISSGGLESSFSTFDKSIRLLDVTIRGKANFSRAEFNSFATIMRCDFRELVYFSDTKFRSRLRIRNSRFNEAVLFERTEFNEASFPLCHFGERAIFSDVDLKAVSFHRSPIESFYFVGCNWLEYEGRAITIDVLSLQHPNEYGEMPSPLPPVRSLSEKDQQTVSAKALGELYRRLKRLARVENDEFLASDWHYLEKEMLVIKLDDDFASRSDWTSGAKTLFMASIVQIYRTCSGYGESPGRALLCGSSGSSVLLTN